MIANLPRICSITVSLLPICTAIEAVVAARQIAAISALGLSRDASASVCCCWEEEEDNMIPFLDRYLLPHSIANRIPATGAENPAATPAAGIV